MVEVAKSHCKEAKIGAEAENGAMFAMNVSQIVMTCNEPDTLIMFFKCVNAFVSQKDGESVFMCPIIFFLPLLFFPRYPENYSFFP